MMGGCYVVKVKREGEVTMGERQANWNGQQMAYSVQLFFGGSRFNTSNSSTVGTTSTDGQVY